MDVLQVSFSTTIILQQASRITLSPYLFALIVEELTELIQDEIPVCFLQVI